MIESPSKKANVEGVKTEVSSLEVESVLPEKNLVLQNLLRAPRYFDSPKWSSSCSSSDKEYPRSTKRRKKQKICHYCGDNHVSTNCKQIRRMFVISSEGNLIRRPEDDDSDVDVCLKCGDTGHDMSSCSNGYDPSDLKEVRCYICNENGHLCCANYKTEQAAAISCYNCGQSGHIGPECPEMKQVVLCSNSELGDQSSSKNPEEKSITQDAARTGKTARRTRKRKNKKKAAKRLSEAHQSRNIPCNANVGPHDAEAGSNRNRQPVVAPQQLPPQFLNLWRGRPGPHHLMQVAQVLRNAPPMNPSFPNIIQIPQLPCPDQGTHVFLPQPTHNPPGPDT